MTLMLVTGCASYRPVPLEHQTKPSLDFQCSNSSAKFDSKTFNSKFASYSDPKQFFSESLNSSESEKDKIDSIKRSGIDAGRSLGEYEAEVVFWDSTLEPSSGQLDAIYNYKSIMYENLVLPKRLIVVDGMTEQSKNILVFKEHSFIVEGEFGFLNKASSWRDFFPTRPLNHPSISITSFDLSMKNKEAWYEGLREGYQEGVCFAYLNYRQGFLNVHDDFTQRYLYVVASKRGLTKPPSVKSIKLDYQVNNEQVDLNSTTFKVEDNGNFRSSDSWGGYDR